MPCVCGFVLDGLWCGSDAEFCWGAKNLYSHALSSVLFGVVIGDSVCFPVMG